MKKLFFVIAILLVAPALSFAANGYGCTALTGGGAGALDALDITGAGAPNADNLAEGDIAIVGVISGTTVSEYEYIFDASGTDAESSPQIIRPDDYATAGVWLLAKLNENMLPDSAARLDQAETIASDWDNTANPWEDNEISDNLSLETIAGTPIITNGVAIGTDDTNHLIDEASNGASSATLYIGNESILASGCIGVAVQGYDVNTTVLGSTIGASEVDADVATQAEIDLKAPLTSPGFTTSANPVSANGASLGTSALEWSDLFLAASGVIYGENDQSNTITSSATGWTFNLDVTVPAEVYGVGWNGSQEAAPKDAVYDKIESLAGGHDPVTIASGITGLTLSTQELSLHAYIEDVAEFTDPNADRIWFWDDTAGIFDGLIVGSGLTLTDKTLTAAGGATAYDDLVNPDANSSIDMTTYTSTMTSAATAGDAYTFTNTAAIGNISVFNITHSTGNATDGTLLELVQTDTDIDPISVVVNSVEVFKLDSSGNLTLGGGVTTAASTDPIWYLKDSDNAAGTAKIFANSSGGVNDIVFSLGPEDSAGENQTYMELDGVTETVDLIKPVVTTAGVTVGTSLELGHASDTTVARSIAGVITVEGVVVPTVSSTNTLTNKTISAGSVIPFTYSVACSDETTDLTTGTSKITFRVPYAMTLTSVRASVNTAPVGSTIIVDINDGGTTIMTTNKLSIDASEETSTTAATAATLTDTAIADDAEITIDIDQIGSSTAGKGLRIVLIGTRTI